MAYIITDIGYDIIAKTNNKMLLSCMPCSKAGKTKSLQQSIYDADLISRKIEESAKVRQQLDVDIFERERTILQSADAKKKIK